MAVENMVSFLYAFKPDGGKIKIIIRMARLKLLKILEICKSDF